MDRRVVDMDMGFTQAINDMLKLEKTYVDVGIQERSVTTNQVKNGNKQEAGVSIAQYAAANEFGTNKIPARSFMRTAFDENINRIQIFTGKQIGLVVDNKQSSEQAFGLIGQFMQALVQMKIRQITTPPNSPVTIAKKKSSKPLIDFGQMIAAVRYVVKKRR